MTEPLVVQCPNCQCNVIIEEINCKIFRHGMYKATGEQMPPHAPKSECDAAAAEGRIYGCGKPFRIDFIQDKWVAFVCDYI